MSPRQACEAVLGRLRTAANTYRDVVDDGAGGLECWCDRPIPPHNRLLVSRGRVSPGKPTVGQARKHRVLLGGTPEPVSHGKRISNWLLKERGGRMQTKRKGGRPMQAALPPKTKTLSHESRWQSYFTHFRFCVIKSRPSVERSLEP